MFWVFVPLPASIPFVTHAPLADFMAAYYEAISSLTTTGHSLIEARTNPLPNSLLYWRAMLHIIGAIGAVTIAITIFSALNLGGPGVHRSRLFTIPEQNFFDSLPKVIRASSVMVVGLALTLTSLLLISGASPRDALSWGTSAATTGLVDPSSATHVEALSGPRSVLVFLGLIAGSVGYVVLDDMRTAHFARAGRDPELLMLIGLSALVTLLVFLAGIPLIQGVGWSVSSLSTSGIALSDSARFDRIPLPLILFPVLIGGSALSAAGGIKLARFVILLKRVSLEFVQLGYRGSVQTFRFRGRILSEKTVMGVWVFLVGYIMACVSGVLVLSILGLSFDEAIRAAVGTLANAGHVIQYQREANVQPLVELGLILGMILGRLEVIALLPALNPAFWRR